MELAHTAVCVPDVEAAAAWYRDVLGMRILSPPYDMRGPEIEADMAELLRRNGADAEIPVAVKAAILGYEKSDRVLELIEYPGRPARPEATPRQVEDTGWSHVGLVCDDMAATVHHLREHGVHPTAGAEIAGLKTTWFTDPYGVLFILMEKSYPSSPYYRQYSPP